LEEYVLAPFISTIIGNYLKIEPYVTIINIASSHIG